MCYNDIELSAQILPPILGLIVNIIGGDLYDWLRRESLLIIMNKIFIWAPKFLREIATPSISNC